jgi:hypothetical protein
MRTTNFRSFVLFLAVLASASPEAWTAPPTLESRNGILNRVGSLEGLRFALAPPRQEIPFLNPRRQRET